MKTVRRALVALMLAGALAPSAAHAEEAAPQTTPGLIDAALAAGTIDEDRATVLRAQALQGGDALPAAYRSDEPWEGTTTMLQVRDGADELSRGELRAAGLDGDPAVNDTSCGTSTGVLDRRLDTTHFRLDSAAGGIAGGLTATDYGTALETAWAKQVDEYGWAAPPTVSGFGGRVHVRIAPLTGGLLGYVTNGGTHADFIGDNPNTPWDDKTSEATCMVLRADMTGLGGGTTAAGLLSSTTAHEFNHTLQFGYGAAGSDIHPDAAMFEGGAAFMEQDTQADDTALFRVFPFPDKSIGGYPSWADQYALFYVLRGMSERFGVGVAGGEEQVMQDFWETLSKRDHGTQMGALKHAFALRGTTAGEEFQNYAIAAKFLHPCGGGFPAGRCFQDATQYRSMQRLLQPSIGGHGAARPGAPWSGAVQDDLALNWVQLPWSASSYDVTLTNTSAGGALRGIAVCDANGTLRVMGSLTPRTAGQAGTITLGDPSPCTTRPFLVVTNEGGGTGNPPDDSTSRTYTVVVAGAKRAARVRWTALSTGTGTIALAPAGGNATDCTATCTVDFDPGTEVTLTGTPDGQGRFLGFSGGGCTGTDPCTVTMDRVREVRVGFGAEDPYQQIDRQYQVVFPASNFLDMRVDRGGIFEYGDQWDTACTTMCVLPWQEIGTPFTLEAAEKIGAGQRQRFRGWEGQGAEDCVDSERTCTFEVFPFGVNVLRHEIIAVAETDAKLTWVQTGQGTMEANTDMDGIPDETCTASCDFWVNETMGPGLKAIPAPGWRFVGWGTGDCDPDRAQYANRCGVDPMSQARTVHGTFEQIPTFALTVATAGTGSGKVTSSPAGIDCGSVCSHDFEENSAVTLTAAPTSSASVLSSWSGACTGSATTCTVTMSQARSVTATFSPAPPPPRFALDVSKGGTGTGAVYSFGSSDIDCGNDCTESYLAGAYVILIANPAAGSTFGAWGGACASMPGPVCALTVNQASAVSVTFTLAPPVTPDPSPGPSPDPSGGTVVDPGPSVAPVVDTTPATTVPAATVPATTPVVPVPTLVLPFVPPIKAPVVAPPVTEVSQVTLPAKQTMAATIKDGITYKLTAPVASTVTATLVVDKKVAKKLGLTVKDGLATAGTGKGTAGPTGGSLKVKLGSKAAKSAKKLKTFPAVLVLTTTSPGKAPVLSQRPVTVGR